VLAASLGRSTGAGGAGVGGDRQLPEQVWQAYMVTYARVDWPTGILARRSSAREPSDHNAPV